MFLRIFSGIISDVHRSHCTGSICPPQSDEGKQKGMWEVLQLSVRFSLAFDSFYWYLLTAALAFGLVLTMISKCMPKHNLPSPHQVQSLCLRSVVVKFLCQLHPGLAFMSRHDLGTRSCKRIFIRGILTPLRLCAGNGSPSAAWVED